ncbi:MAG: RidA family protein [Oscillospiraceae bacterium]|nr:RidA family protein [Oscillospiraceae bacterium]
MRIISTDKAPAAVGPYSQAIVTGGVVFLSGQLGLVPESGALAEGGTLGQTKQIFANIDAVLREAGTAPENVVKTTCFLTDIGDFAAFNELYAAYFTGKPARSCIEVSALPKGASVEVEVIAEIL